MGRVVVGTFPTREQAEQVVEHLVQQHGVDPKAVSVTAAEDANTAGDAFDIVEAERGGPDPQKKNATALRGSIRIAADVAQDDLAGIVEQTFRSYGAAEIRSQ